MLMTFNYLFIFILTITIMSIISSLKEYINPMLAGILIGIPVVATFSLNKSPYNYINNQILVYLLAIFVFISWYFYLINTLSENPHLITNVFGWVICGVILYYYLIKNNHFKKIHFF